jgi:hypothetical protein
MSSLLEPRQRSPGEFTLYVKRSRTVGYGATDSSKGPDRIDPERDRSYHRSVERWDLIDHLLDIALAEDPATIAERLLRALLAFNGGACAALFEVSFDHLRLFASRGLDQAALDAADALWRSGRVDMHAGRPALTAAAIGFPVLRERLTAPGDRPPLFTAPGDRLTGVLFAERTPSAGFSDARELQALSQFARVAARALAGGRGEAAAYLAATPPAEVARDQLFAILEHNEWNIARVARLLGVTRPTIYARLQRLGLPRQRLRLGKRQAT